METSSTPGGGQLDATLQALQGGDLVGLAPQASGNIQSWIQTLKNSNNGQVKGIIPDLQRLDDVLSGGTPDNGQLSQLLHTLGEHTIRAAESADPGSEDKLRQLGQALSFAASQIS